MTENNYIDDDDENCFGSSYPGKSKYNDPKIFMVSWWGPNYIFNNEHITIDYIEIMTDTYGSSGSFGSRLMYKSIVYNIYTYRRINLRSKTSPIHGPVHKYYSNYSYSISHFHQLPQGVAKK